MNDKNSNKCEDHETNIQHHLPSKFFGFCSRCTSAIAIFTQAKFVGEALKQNAGYMMGSTSSTVAI